MRMCYESEGILFANFHREILQRPFGMSKILSGKTSFVLVIMHVICVKFINLSRAIPYELHTDVVRGYHFSCKSFIFYR